jgi:SAM-dependent methyltransferase
MPELTSAAERWAEDLRAWGIPEPILRAAPEPPYGFPTELFRQRAERATRSSPTPTTLRALEALPDGGTVLDVGVGGGATSLPLAERAATIVGVDGSADMLETFRTTAETIGITARTIQGAWPEIVDRAEPADVVVCGHVLYNVQDIAPFVGALTTHAAHRVVVELTERHPWTWMNDLWLRFHALERPDVPTAEDAASVLRELGTVASREDRVDTEPSGGFEHRSDAVALVRRRLCLPPDRDPELEQLLGDRLAEAHGLWSSGPLEQRIVTLWWDVG